MPKRGNARSVECGGRLEVMALEDGAQNREGRIAHGRVGLAASLVQRGLRGSERRQSAWAVWRRTRRIARVSKSRTLYETFPDRPWCG